VLDVDHFKRVNDRFGHAAGDDVLRRLGELLAESFRGEDVAARWGGEEFVLALYGLARADGLRRLEDLLARFSAQEERLGRRVTFTAGLAEYPVDGAELDTLFRAADGALLAGKAGGRGQVVAVGALPPVAPRQAEVVLVEDDAAIAELLLHALAARGYRTRWIADGEEAADVLAGSGAPAPAVLLDVDLPGIDGLSLLRRMARRGVLERSRVIMLTARSGEGEVLEALELGAFDHVAKPFSVPVLMERLQRALPA